MEALAATASVAAVVSITVQLADQINKLYRFWEAISDAPRDIQTIVEDLRYLLSVLDQIRQNGDDRGSNATETTTKILQTCEEQVRSCLEIVDGLERRLQSQRPGKRIYAAFKSTLKSEKIRRFRESLQNIKITLLLARATRSNESTRARDELLLSTITQGFARLQTQCESQNIRTTSATAQLDVEDHAAALQAEVARITSTQAPIARHALGSLANTALEESANRFQQKLHLQVVARCCGRGPASRLSKLPCYRTPKKSSTREFRSRSRQEASSQGRIQGLRDSEPTKVHSSEEERQLTPDADVHAKGLRQDYTSRQTSKCLISRSNDTYTTIFGTVTSSWSIFKVHLIRDDQTYESIEDEGYFVQETMFRVHPAQWLLQLGLTFGFQFKSTNGWQYMLETYRAVPDNSEIFQLCKSGNIQRIHVLLSERKASVWDQAKDSPPCILQHYPGKLMFVSFCWKWERPVQRFQQFLGIIPLKQNQNRDYCTPLRLAIEFSTPALGLPLGESLIKIYRLFQDQFDFLDQENEAWTLLDRLTEATNPLTSQIDYDCGCEIMRYIDEPRCPHRQAKVDSLIWLLSIFRIDIKGQIEESRICDLLSDIQDSTAVFGSAALDALLDVSDNMVDAMRSDGSSILHQLVFDEFECEGAKHLIKRGANLHLLARSPLRFGVDNWESPLSLAMRGSIPFYWWRKVLEESNVNLDSYIECACQERPLVEGGWTKDSLLALFRIDLEHFRTTDAEVLRVDLEYIQTMEYYWDCACCDKFVFHPIEPRWQAKLEKIKASHGTYKEDRHTRIAKCVEATNASGDEEDSGEWEDISDAEQTEEIHERWQDAYNYLCVRCWNLDSDPGPCYPMSEEGQDSSDDEDSSDNEDSHFLPPLPF